MKKLFKYLMLPVLAAASFSCSRLEPIEFVHEKQAFESREGKILIEAIMPTATTADEEIYIVGAFNGDTAKAYLNPAYLMERSAVIPQKWGIYLDPSDFETGKTLADGFTFASVAQGWERTATGKPETHCLDIKAGEWANVYVDKWEKYFEKPAEGGEGLPEHEGTVRIYITDNSGWDEIALYQWGDTNDLGGGWPGMQVTGTLNYNGVTYKYFEYAEADIIGKGQNLIFNNSGNVVNGGTDGRYCASTYNSGTNCYWFNVNTTAYNVNNSGACTQGGMARCVKE